MGRANLGITLADLGELDEAEASLRKHWIESNARSRTEALEELRNARARQRRASDMWSMPNPYQFAISVRGPKVRKSPIWIQRQILQPSERNRVDQESEPKI